MAVISALAPLFVLLFSIQVSGQWSSEESAAFDFGQPQIPSMDDVITNTIAFAEDRAEYAAEHCRALGIPVDYESLKTDMVDCYSHIMNLIITRGLEVMMGLRSRQEELENLQQTLMASKKLTPKQRQLLTRKVFTPLCAAMVPAVSECQDPKYETLGKVDRSCTPDFDKDSEEMGRVYVRDVCRNNGAWILDFLDAGPIKCVAESGEFAQTKKYRSHMEYLHKFQVDKNSPGAQRRLQSHEELCNITGVLGEMLSDWHTSGCKSNPKPGAIFMSAFVESRKFWNSKCGPEAKSSRMSSGSAAGYYIGLGFQWTLLGCILCIILPISKLSHP